MKVEKELVDMQDVLNKIIEYMNQFDPVEQHEITDAIAYLYEEIRILPKSKITSWE